jgi:endonuclease/exonuclease/phosphatase family metal-dependent hydrolase
MPRVPIVLLLAMLVIFFPGLASGRAQEANPQAAALAEPIELRVMTFNVWVGGGVQVDLAKVVEAIEVSGADVVGLQEAEGHPRLIAEALGWLYVDERMQVISRYPLIDPPGANGLYTFVEVRPGQVLAIANVHLPSDPYGPEAVRDGATPEEVLALERETRLPLFAPVLERLPELVDAGIPAVITGDFNTPSPLDWTAETAASRDQVRFPLAWPVGVAALEAGIRDTFREAHPDPVARAGLTWTPGYPHPTLRPGETLDRIDWVLAAGNIEVLASEVVGEEGNPDVDLAVTPWPSDHRGVVSTLRITPGEPPLLVAVNRRVVAPGEEIIVRYHAPGEEGDRVSLVPTGGDAVTDALMSLPSQESFVDGAVVFGTGTLAPGAYEAVLTGADGGELARIPFRVQEPAAKPTLTVDEPSIAAGEPITVNWDNAPGNKWDWVGIYAASDPDLYNYLGFLYTEAEIAGSVVFDEAALGGALEPGDYEARLMRDDGYVVLATAPFTVLEDAG